MDRQRYWVLNVSARKQRTLILQLGMQLWMVLIRGLEEAQLCSTDRPTKNLLTRCQCHGRKDRQRFWVLSAGARKQHTLISAARQRAFHQRGFKIKGISQCAAVWQCTAGVQTQIGVCTPP